MPSSTDTARDAIADGSLRLGRLRCRVRIGEASNADALSQIFKQALSAERPRGPSDIDIDLREDDGGGPWPAIAADAATVADTASTFAIASEAVYARLDRAGSPAHLIMRTRQAGLPPEAFRVHLSIALHRVLLALGAAYLHAAAVSVGARTYLFVGEKGAGKSTLSVGLARLGATVLADDHVLIERAAPRYRVSGCEVTSRIAADTEAHVFAEPLPVVPQDFAGTMKKEFLLADYFSAAPHVARDVDAIYFIGVGRQLAVTPWSAQRTALDLLDRTRKSFRPQTPGEVGLLLDFWVGLAQAAPAFALELDPVLTSLARLPDLLHA